ncbi:MAG: glycosyltransferase family 4 protein [Planctomycetales bacterium]|nr:glycosyltransferase family 4 protein [Planctomycetales bacterium]
MKILLCHNYYQQPGGEDQVFADESRLLEARGHQVVQYTRHNDEVASAGRMGTALRTIWSGPSYGELKRIIRRERPQIVHFTNTFPLISPAAYYAAQAAGAKVVQSLHNYRLLCPSGLLLRDGQACEECLAKRIAWPAVRHGCYRGKSGSAVVAAMLAGHRAMGTWTSAVDRYIALTRFARAKFIAGGLPERKISLKPNFVDPDPGPGDGADGYAIFVGRLSEEKGIDTLLAACHRLESPTELRIIGDGPLRDQVEAACARDVRIRWLGRRPIEQVLEAIGRASLLVFPSNCYETFGRTIAEAFAKGTPVIASDLGAAAELVTPGLTGATFAVGNPEALAGAVAAAQSDPERLAAMRGAARREYEQHYTPDANYEMLMAIYSSVLAGDPAVAPALPAEPSATQSLKSESASYQEVSQ